MSEKVTLLFTVVMCVVMLLSGCAAAPTPTPTAAEPTAPRATEPPTTEPTPQDELVRPLVVAWYSTPPQLSFDVTGGLITGATVNLCDPLVGYKRQPNQWGFDQALISHDPQDFEGRLAESWEVSSDGTTFTFYLRKGVKSPYGNELTADDVKWSMERALGGKFAGRWGAYSILQLDSPDSVTVIDDYTVEFKTRAPNPLFMPFLPVTLPGIHDSTELKKHVTTDDPWGYEWTKTHDACFGPWHVEAFVPGVEVVFVPNPYYYDGPPYWSKVIWREVPVSSNRMALLQAGEVDVASRLVSRELQELAENPAITVPRAVTNLTHQWRLNVEVPPFDDQRVRQAMAYAIPYNDILEKVYYGTAEPMRSFIMPWSFGYDPDPWVYTEDLEKAKALLAEAGYADGLDISVMYSPLYPEYEELAVLIKSNLAKIGVTLNLEKVPEATFNTNRFERKFMSTIDYEMMQVPIGVYAAMATFSSGPGGIVNFGNYANPEVEDLIDQALSEPNLEKHLAIYQELQEIIAEDVPWVYLAIVPPTDAFKSTIEGWTWYPNNYAKWYDLYEVAK